MERYTYFENGKWCLRVGKARYSGPWVDRLAAYEDTGLEAVQVKALGAKMMQIYSGTAEDIILDMKLLADHMECEKYRAIGTVEELYALVKAKDEGRSQFANDAGGVLLHYIREQRRLMRDIASAPDEPRKDIMYRHEADKLYMLESIAIDAGHDMQRTVTYDRAEAEAAIGGGGDG